MIFDPPIQMAYDKAATMTDTMSLTDNTYDLERFVTAQAPFYPTVLRELRSGQKQSHWMWFVFPQLRGLGRSETSQFYGISGFAEAAAYLEHPTLSERLTECTQLVLKSPASSVTALFGKPDDEKFRSSMTLFAVASMKPASVFHRALEEVTMGPDTRTLELLRSPRL
ncbi:MAG: DUF1810 domain-containing protein [Asticcacaulis sp.]|uniref:DUF1810 domain-containing protein n=1 Tax=Asticcacaulis sp. TaxID=1872648 RepID=UPI0039E389CE